MIPRLVELGDFMPEELDLLNECMDLVVETFPYDVEEEFWDGFWNHFLIVIKDPIANTMAEYLKNSLEVGLVDLNFGETWRDWFQFYFRMQTCFGFMTGFVLMEKELKKLLEKEPKAFDSIRAQIRTVIPPDLNHVISEEEFMARLEKIEKLMRENLEL